MSFNLSDDDNYQPKFLLMKVDDKPPLASSRRSGSKEPYWTSYEGRTTSSGSSSVARTTCSSSCSGTLSSSSSYGSSLFFEGSSPTYSRRQTNWSLSESSVSDASPEDNVRSPDVRQQTRRREALQSDEVRILNLRSTSSPRDETSTERHVKHPASRDIENDWHETTPKPNSNTRRRSDLRRQRCKEILDKNGLGKRASSLQRHSRCDFQQNDTCALSDDETSTISSRAFDDIDNESTDSRNMNNSYYNNDCILCDSIVNERQHYMWNSRFVKSSLCSRCSKNQNSGVGYISFWGKESYELGSWRKRLKQGRETTIDLTPLIDVLAKIDSIDTSMGRLPTVDDAIHKQIHSTNNQNSPIDNEINYFNHSPLSIHKLDENENGDVNETTDRMCKDNNEANDIDDNVFMTNKHDGVLNQTFMDRSDNSGDSQINSQTGNLIENESVFQFPTQIHSKRVANSSKPSKENDASHLTNQSNVMSVGANCSNNTTREEVNRDTDEEKALFYIARSNDTGNKHSYEMNSRHDKQEQREQRRSSYSRNNHFSENSGHKTVMTNVDMLNDNGNRKSNHPITDKKRSGSANKYTNDNDNEPLKKKESRISQDMSASSSTDEDSGPSFNNLMTAVSSSTEESDETSSSTDSEGTDNEESMSSSESTGIELSDITNQLKDIRSKAENSEQGISRGVFLTKYLKNFENKAEEAHMYGIYGKGIAQNINPSDVSNKTMIHPSKAERTRCLARDVTSQLSVTDNTQSRQVLNDRVAAEVYIKRKANSNSEKEGFSSQDKTVACKKQNSKTIIEITNDISVKEQASSESKSNVKRTTAAQNSYLDHFQKRRRSSVSLHKQLKYIRDADVKRCDLRNESESDDIRNDHHPIVPVQYQRKSPEKIIEREEKRPNEKHCSSERDKDSTKESTDSEKTMSRSNTQRTNESINANVDDVNVPAITVSCYDVHDPNYNGSVTRHNKQTKPRKLSLTKRIAKYKKDNNLTGKFKTNSKQAITADTSTSEDEESCQEDDSNKLQIESNGHGRKLNWRTRGYQPDFFMSRQSVTGGEIIDCYNKALSHQREKSRRQRRQRKEQRREQQEKEDFYLTPVSEVSSATSSRKSSGADYTLPQGCSRSDSFDASGLATGVVLNVDDLKRALDRAGQCSDRMSKRLEIMLER